MASDIDFTPSAEAWLKGLSRHDRARMVKQIDKVREGGPTLGRPTVDSVKASRHSNMKEVRVPSTGLRALFAFGPDRRAIVLAGTDKSKNNRAFRDTVRTADRLLDGHLRSLGKGSTWRATRAGTRSAGSSR